MDEGRESMCEKEIITQARTVSLVEKLTEREKDTKQKLADLTRAREILTNNPELEELLTILGRSGRSLL